jgi:hypothetical protein
MKTNGIKASPHDMRAAIASNLANQTLLKPIVGNGQYNQMVQVTSEVKDVNVDFSSDKVEIAFMLRVLAAASTKDLTKRQVFDGTTAGKALDGIAGLVSGLGLTKFTLPLSLLAAFIPQDKAPKIDDNGLAFDYIFPFGPDNEAEDKNPPESDNIEQLIVSVKFRGGFCCSDEDGDSFVNITARLDSYNVHAEDSVRVWGDSSHDPAAPGQMRGDAGHCYYTTGIKMTFPNGGEIEKHKTYEFHCEWEKTIDTPNGQLPLVLSFGVKAGAEPDNTPIFNDNVTTAWIEPFSVTLSPIRVF